MPARRHQLDAADANRVLLVVSEQREDRTVGRRRLVEPLGLLHFARTARPAVVLSTRMRTMPAGQRNRSDVAVAPNAGTKATLPFQTRACAGSTRASTSGVNCDRWQDIARWAA